MKNGGGSTEATGTHIAAVVSHLPTPDSGRAGRAPLNVAGIAQILAGPAKNFHLKPRHKSNTDPSP